ncbi:hypothetical protein D4R71_06770 [bacterium]|nr:MAG: hypothetical protein D4R71_06770 [bacterium]
MNLDDILEFGAESLLKSFMRKELLKEGIDLDNWQRKTASILSGALGGIVGGMLGGPLGILLGSMFWGVAQSAQYDGDSSPEEIKQKYREALRLKAIEKCMQIIADNTSAELHPRFREAFYEASDRYAESDSNANSYEVERMVRNVFASVDYDTARKFDKLYSAAIEVIG